MQPFEGVDMQAGRELDKLIAEKVFGWKRITVPAEWVKEFGADPAGTEVYPPDAHEAWRCLHDPLPYSTDIAAAWTVVEKMVNNGKLFIVKGDGLRAGDFQPKWTVLCENNPRIDAITAPLAICLAALAECGHIVKEKEDRS